MTTSQSPHRPRKSRRVWPTLLLLLLVFGGGGLALFMKRRAAQGQTIDPTLIAKVSRGELELAVVELGKIEPREKVAVKSKVAGQVEKLLVDEGMQVKQGQLLLWLDPTEFQRNVTRARQDVEKAKAGLELAELMHERRKRALADRAVAQSDVDTAENEWKTRRIALDQAKEAQNVAEDQLRYSRIVSPLDGTVIQRGIRVGETVVPGTMATLDQLALLTIADLSVLIAKADLNQIDIARVKLGQDVTLTLDALPGKTFKAKVSKIAPASVLPKGKDVEVFPVEATLVAPGGGEIKPGMTADIKIHVETKKDVLKLPIEAVAKEKGQSFVNRIVRNPDGKTMKTERVDVKLGARTDREQEILEGVKEGDEVQIKPPSAEANEFK